MNTRPSVHENSFFSLRRAKIDKDNVSYWDILRKIPVLPGEASEILEVLAAALIENPSAQRLLVPISEHYLFRDLQGLGCRWIGYALDSGKVGFAEDDESWLLWEGSRGIKIESLKTFDSSLGNEATRFHRYVLEFDSELSHDPAFESRTYFTFVRSRERYFSGLTENHYLKSKRLWDLPKPPSSLKSFPKVKLQRKVVAFQDVTSIRSSSLSFKSKAALSRKELDAVFADSYFKRADGHHPVASAGGFSNLGLILAMENHSELNDGIYHIDSTTREWALKQAGKFVKPIFQSGFSQDTFKGCSSWIGITANLQKAAEKYGNRSYRFSMIGAGSLAHALHLSCISYGLQFRLMGGFDDGVIHRLLEPSIGEEMIVTLAGIGK
jgi:SagB-type dehydrogenase family enzyme